MLRIIRFCKPYLRKNKWKLFLFVFICTILSLATIAATYVTGRFIDHLTSAADTSGIIYYVVLLAFLGLLELVLGFICERLYLVLQINSSYDLESAAIKHLHNASPQYLHGKDAAYINHQLNNDSNLSMMFCINTSQKIITNMTTLIIPLVFMFVINRVLGIVLFTLNIIYAVVFAAIKKPMYSADYEMMEARSHYFSKEYEQIKYSDFIKSQGINKGFISRLTSAVIAMKKKTLKHQAVSYCFTGSDTVLKTIALVFIFLIGGAAIIAKEMSIGDLTILMSFFSISLASTQYFFTLGKDTQEIKVACDRLEKLFDVNEQPNGNICLKSIEQVSCRELSFSYGEDPAISCFTASFDKGKLYALAGDNGSGKSTLIRLMLGLYVSEFSGTISYNGVLIDKLDLVELRKTLVGFSEQEPMLLPETLRYNLTFDDNAELNEKHLQSLSTMLGADDFLSSLPEGLDTVIREGSVNLSGGEKQKLSILRALLKKPQLLLLDEPTSALDKQSRTNLIEYLRSECSDMIVIISTHDKELLGICDEILRVE